MGVRVEVMLMTMDNIWRDMSHTDSCPVFVYFINVL